MRRKKPWEERWLEELRASMRAAAPEIERCYGSVRPWVAEAPARRDPAETKSKGKGDA